MSITSAVVRELIAAGLEGESLIAALERIEAASAPVRTARQERDRRYYEAHREQKIAAVRARQVEKKATESVGNDGNATESDGNLAPLSQGNVLPHPPKTQLSPPSKGTPKGAPKGSPDRKHPWPDDYRDQVWAIYPKRDEKKDGMAALDAVHRADSIPFEVITEGIRRLAAHVEDPKFAPALHRWLKKERWNDEYPTRPHNAQHGNHDGRTHSAARPQGTAARVASLMGYDPEPDLHGSEEERRVPDRSPWPKGRHASGFLDAEPDAAGIYRA